MKKQILVILFLFLSVFAINTFAKNREEVKGSLENSVAINRITNDDIIVTVPSIIFTFKETDITLKFKNPRHGRLILNDDKLHFIINGEDTELNFVKGEAHFSKKFDTDRTLTIYSEEFGYSKNITVVPLWAMLLPIVLIFLWGIRKIMKK